MAKTFRSGAFLQQCVEIHRAEIRCQSLVPPATVVLRCGVCEISSRVSLPDAALGDEEVQKLLAECVTGHPGRLRVQGMAIQADELTFFCEACRSASRLTELSFESTLED